MLPSLRSLRSKTEAHDWNAETR